MFSKPPRLILAPMQRITDYPFLSVISHFGGPDAFVTEYFRVHCHSNLEPYILRSIDENPTGRPIYAQMIGQDIPELVRSAKELIKHPVKGVDLNLGCPAPIVCRKDAGGGLLRNLAKVDQILGALRDAIPSPYEFTVKTRVGYTHESEFEALLEIFAKHEIDSLAIHGRTVLERYQTPVHCDEVKLAVETLSCPVYANGNVVDVQTGLAYLKESSAAGLMVGRGAIRNPWIFSQLRAAFMGESHQKPRYRDLLEYIELLWSHTATAHQGGFDPTKHVQKMKRYMNYITQGIDEEFEYKVRRAKTQEDFFKICEFYLNSSEEIPALPPEKSKLFCGFSDLLSK